MIHKDDITRKRCMLKGVERTVYMEIGFRYGLLCDDLEKQATEQGFTLGEKAELMEKFRNAINLLGIHSILTETEVNKAFKRLQKEVIKSLRRIPKLYKETDV